MPIIQVENSIPANGTNDNTLRDSQFEFLPYNAQLEFGIVAAATGLIADVYSGQDTLCESMALSTANRFAIYPDDFTLTDVAAAGERLKVRVRNTTAAAVICRTTLRITPL